LSAVSLTIELIVTSIDRKRERHDEEKLAMNGHSQPFWHPEEMQIRDQSSSLRDRPVLWQKGERGIRVHFAREFDLKRSQI
jgi:hypothetical protein